MIAVIDYGMGNLLSVSKALESVVSDVEVTSDPKVVRNALGVVLPGVGAFADCMQNLRSLELDTAIKQFIASKRPYLGICLGLQILFSHSEEGGLVEGLNIIRGSVKRLPSTVKVPHMGWNQISKRKPVPLFEGIADQSNFYFVHSYYVDPDDEHVIATSTDYGISFTSAVWRENVYGVQFHPEKSSRLGLQMLHDFGRIVYDNISGC
jgi:glutamine amidotransferase